MVGVVGEVCAGQRQTWPKVADARIVCSGSCSEVCKNLWAAVAGRVLRTASREAFGMSEAAV